MERRIVELVKGQIKYGEYRRAQLTDAGLGLCGETAEVVEAALADNNEEVLKELGDVIWYFYSLAEAMDIVGAFFDIDELDGAIADGSISMEYDTTAISIFLLTKTGYIADVIKKLTMKGISIESSDFVKRLRELQVTYGILAHRAGYTLHDVAAQTIIKISERYPNGFANGEVR